MPFQKFDEEMAEAISDWVQDLLANVDCSSDVESSVLSLIVLPVPQ